MNQSELEHRVIEIFERQGFEVEKDGNSFTAEKGNQSLELKVFSSEKFDPGEVETDVKEGEKVFLDEGLEELKEDVENDVSVLREQREEKEYDLPSYEIIGNIAVINQLVGMDKEEAVEGILHHNPQVETVLLKQEGLKGEFRVGEYEKLYGEQTETTHREFGCLFRVDPTEVYFSERFGTERKRITDQVEEGENILVIGAGVGLFPVLAGKKRNPEKVVAVEKNPKAFEYLKQNIQLNDLEDKIEALEADAEEIDLEMDFDRVIVPIPEFAYRFLPVALKHVKENGKIHYYRFLEDGNWEELETEIKQIAEDKDTEVEIVNRVECGDRGPSVKRVCLKVRVKQ